ncbi:hypothetical protein [Priestia megaterium]|uniref:hypothetical protein n=1 Tax=Priestia megaterium TaxID=1404 RepID=UPI0011457E10|nr:hypothetical protein [Priestia megaterium]
MSIAMWVVENYGFDGYLQFKSILILLTGLILGGLLMMLHSAFVMKDVRPNEKLTKVSILVVDGTIFTSPPNTIFESLEKRFFIFLYKVGLFRKSIEFHNMKRMRFIFTTYLTTLIVVATFGLYLSLTLAFSVDEKLSDNHVNDAIQNKVEQWKKE